MRVLLTGPFGNVGTAVRREIAGLTFHPPTIPVITSGDVTSVDHWVRHVRDTVRFADTLATITGRGATTGPASTPRPPTSACPGTSARRARP